MNQKKFRFFTAALLIVAIALSSAACNNGGGNDGGNGGNNGGGNDGGDTSTIAISKATLTFNSEGGFESGNTVTVTGAEWSASTTYEWITISPASGVDGGTFTVTVTATSETRAGTITVTNATDPADIKNVTVIQDAPNVSGVTQFYLNTISVPINWYGGDNIELTLVSYNSSAGDTQSGYRISFDLVAPLGSGGIADGTYVLSTEEKNFTIQKGTYSAAYVITLGNFGPIMELTSATLTADKASSTLKFTVGFTENGEEVEINGIYTGQY